MQLLPPQIVCFFLDDSGYVLSIGDACPSAGLQISGTTNQESCAQVLSSYI